MITSVDTNVLLDMLVPGAPHGDESARALYELGIEGPLVISAPVYAELAGQFPERMSLDEYLHDMTIQLEPSSNDMLYVAGLAWQRYARNRPASTICPACGVAQDVHCEGCGEMIRARQHVLADFLIGAHALMGSDRLFTRDRGLYRTYFPELALL